MSNKQRRTRYKNKLNPYSLKKIGTQFQPYNIKSHISLLLCTYKYVRVFRVKLHIIPYDNRSQSIIYLRHTSCY